MEYFVAVILTLFLFVVIIKLIGFYEIKNYKNVVNRQSYYHYLSKITSNKPRTKKINSNVSQMSNLIEKSSIKAMIIEDRAYWVLDNTFYVADAKNGNVNPETTRPVEIENVSKHELDKLLFILDKLKDEDK